MPISTNWPLSVLICYLIFLDRIFAQTWCNKNYMATQPIVPPGGRFPIPATSATPLLALRCSQAVRPYLPEDNGSSDVAILVDAPLTFAQINNAVPITFPKGNLNGVLQVTVLVDGKKLTSGSVPLNATKHALPFSLAALRPRKEAYAISCQATLASQTFHATGSLTYLPSLPAGIGSVTKLDLRTGALLARPANGNGGSFSPVFPIGFYTQFDNFLAQNLSVISELKSQGFTIIHPIPSFGNITSLDAVLDEMQRVGLYVMYDMRGTYMNATAVTAEVNRIKSRPNLLLWYTADEPDGTSDPLDATLKASNLITSLDGGNGTGGAGYHPISLVLNCENYQWSAYTSGTDIVMQDTYMIGNNVTFSSQWGTVCTQDYGDCGCDNCKGSFEDISTRMDEFRDRLFINGWERTKAVWTVPQGFGNDTYWKRLPTGKEFVVQSILGINHGALGVVSWDDPTTPDIKSSASALALALPKMNPFILSPNATFRQLTINRVDIGLWTLGKSVLVLSTNMNYQAVAVKASDLGLSGHFSAIDQVFDGGARMDASRQSLLFDSVGSSAFVFQNDMPSETLTLAPSPTNTNVGSVAVIDHVRDTDVSEKTQNRRRLDQIMYIR